MYKNKILWLVLYCNFIGFSQNTKPTDTIYVYEEVIVYDTVFIEKPMDKMKFNKIIFTPKKDGKKAQLSFIQNNKTTIITVDSLLVESKRKPFPISWNFGIKFITGFNSNSFFKDFNDKVQMNFGLGVFIKKTLFHPSFAIGTGFDAFISTNTFNFDSTKNNSSLNGFYFTNDGNPKLFNSLNNQGFQIQIPLQFYWNIKKFTPSLGVFGNISSYKATFIGSSGAAPLSFDAMQLFAAKAYYFGYLAQLDYQLNKRWSVGLNYSFSNATNLIFKSSSNDTFAISKNITQNNFGVNLLYFF